MVNRLYYGDNLSVLRESIVSESVDLIYLDPPFNSDASYNVLFKAPSGEQSAAQIEAFDDSWHWTDAAELAFDEVMTGPHSDAAVMLRAMRSALGENDMMAYLAMMAVRLIELHRVLKPTGSLYLHCDPTASHYLKILLDAIFGALSYRSEIVWKRTNARGTPSNWPHVHDVIFHYSEDTNKHRIPKAKADKAKMPHTLITWSDGLKYQTFELTGAGITKNGDTGKPWRGFNPTDMGRHWGNGHAQLDEWAQLGLIHFPADGGFPRRRDEFPFDPESRMVTVGDVWTDIDRLNQTAKERLGYPTQKPVALLERIISASSQPGDVVLDPFCGCGTTIHAAQKLGRQWIGVDITHLAISLIERRMKEAFPGISYDVNGVPKDFEAARHLAARDKHEFQKWIVGVIGGQPYKGGKKGMDRGIDGYLHFRDAEKTSQFGIISVKGGGIKSGDIRDLKGTMDREKASLGIFLTLNEPTREMEREAAAAGIYETGGLKVPKLQILTAAQILDNRRPQVPFGHSEGYKKAEREIEDRQGSLL
ncbi:DNA methyltransferase [Rhizobium leguminosarum]|uniref:DNA methyltransferase n=1 Tax=Rhizobium leguminosarum TaxID=384 RepID=UPI0003774C90|nr:DNA methyltransferase [Rhizobium leguminosarum]